MMTLEQHLLQKLQEELTEVAKPASKAVIFGILDINPKTNRTNLSEISEELIDVLVIIDLLDELRFMPKMFEHKLLKHESLGYYHRKVVKVIRYVYISMSLRRCSLTRDEQVQLKAISKHNAEQALKYDT